MPRWDSTFESLLRAHLPWLPASAELSEDLVLASFGLDSMGSIGLIASLEDTYAVSLLNDELDLADYSTPGSIWTSINSSARTRIEDLLQRTGERWPDRPAVSDRNGTYTFADLNQAAHRAALWLQRQGVRKGDRVVLQLPGDRDFTALLFGVLCLGAIAVPVNPKSGSFHLQWILDDAKPALHVSEVDGDMNAESTSFVRPTGLSPTELGLLMYTSGSTGMPRAVACPHENVVFAAKAIGRRLGYTPEDVVLCRIPVSFDYGLYQILLAMATGAHVVLRPDLPEVITLRAARAVGATIVPLVPTLAAILTQLSQRDSRPTSIRMFTNTGAALSGNLASRLRDSFPGTAVVPMYGMTECKRITIADPDEDLDHPATVGRALDGTEVLVVDDSGTALRAGEVGEIWVRGPHVMAGYWGVADDEQQRFCTEPGSKPTLHTGDYGWLDDDGRLYVVGRRDDMFKRRGVRMTTLEVETAALDVPGVVAASALPPGPDEQLIVWVVGDVAAEEVIEGMAQRVEQARVPDRCIVVESLPATANGKVDKKALLCQPTAN